MKKKRLHIVFAWLLLICFVAGQYMVYSHQHALIKGITKHSQTAEGHQTVKEKCLLCDAMHHTDAVTVSNNTFLVPLLTSDHVFKAGDYDFVSIALILSAGRAPPVTA
ncbi:hypothetical protein MTO98_00235 [Mucilaginibacter sp. SMC90]|uniref:hypothetical protein n=1 Tax=Mucilaginibacter sp. SMC90 TaxID=2929803 RepID=UPI001FB3C503|nr:hypothetical protein [Mucilaginibacter sp. SMC90]UOE49498.1 hypothetical protein MTO98_00235 [Mucilaginibacter sp. SMC90]